MGRRKKRLHARFKELWTQDSYNDFKTQRVYCKRFLQVAPMNHINDVNNDINFIPSNLWKFIIDKNNNNIYLHKKRIPQICSTRGYILL